MRLSEEEYRKLCQKMGLKYQPPSSSININNTKSTSIKRHSSRDMTLWEDRRRRRKEAEIGQGETIIINGRFPGLNEIISAAKGHYGQYAKMKSKNSGIVTFAAMDQCKLNYNHISISILWVEPNRKRDKDNISAGVKFILDGLIDAAIIPDDGWSQIKNIYHNYEIDKERPRVEISITEVEK